jgi:CzcA family heavy metal efflux pump
LIRSIVRFSIRQPGVVIVLAAAIVVYGVYSLLHAKVDVFPEFSPTQVVIQTEAPGLPAELVETLVTQPIENSLSGVAGVQLLRSQSIPGLSVVTITFADASDIFRNRQLVSERLTALSFQLPQGIMPAMTPLTSSASTVLGLGVTSEKRSLAELRSLVDATVRPHLLSVAGVADVNVFGGDVRQWQIQVQPGRLLQHELTLNDVLLAARRATGVLGAGYVENANQRIVVRTEGQSLTLAQLRQVVVKQRAGVSLTLADVAEVQEASAPSISAAAINGKPGVFLMVQGQLGANTRAVTLALEKSLRDLEPLLEKEQVKLHPKLFRPANFIETAIGNVRQDILIGSTLVVIVLFLFLFNARTAIISATAIPLSLLAATLALGYFNVSLNIMVLGGLAIALGEVVDDAIIDTENIFRRLRENRSASHPLPAWQVVFDASMEVRSSVVYATFIVALVFVPLLTLGGVAGKLFAPLGLAYIFAILASLVVALTLTPALAYLLLARTQLTAADPPFIRFIKPRYLSLLAFVERHPVPVMATVVIVLAAGMALLPLFSGEFIPPLKEGHYIIHMTAVPGTSEKESLRIGSRVAEQVLKIRGVQSIAQWVGRARNGADTFGTHYSEFEVEIGPLPGAEQKRILREIRQTLMGDDGDDDKSDERAKGERLAGGGFPGVSFAVNTFLTERIEETVTGFAAPVVVHIFGPDLDYLDRDAQGVAAALSGVAGAADVQVQAPPGAPELTIRLRHDRLALWGLAPVDVLEAVQTAYEGSVVGQVYRGAQAIEVAATLDPRQRGDIAQVGNLALRSADGKWIKLADVSDIQQTQGRYKILHAEGKRQQTLTCNVVGRDIDTFFAQAREKISRDVKFAPGNFMVLTGAAEAQARARADLIVHALLAGVGIFVLLYVAFNSLVNLGITFLNLPFALFGGVIAVVATGGWLSLGSLVGFVTLFGITLRNSIMLVSHYQHLITVEEKPWNSETAKQGAAERLPSILMTALVTALGLLPLALGSGEPGREIEGPMAAIIVGGLATSTILNLLILPTLLLHFGSFAAPAHTPSGASHSWRWLPQDRRRGHDD